MKTATVQPRGCTNFKTRQLSRVLSRRYDAELAKAGLKTTQYSLLTHVLRLGPITPGELARHMGLDASTLTRNMQPMVASGWLLQDPGTDARSRSISITAEGRVKRSEAQQHWKAAQRGINAVLGVARVNALHKLLDDCLPLLEGRAPQSH
jgi:DNA-binding MarR family transcriptional regulator